MAPNAELKEWSAPRVAHRAEIDFFQQVTSPGARTACALEPIRPVVPLDGLVEIARFYQVRGTDFLNLFVGSVRPPEPTWREFFVSEGIPS